MKPRPERDPFIEAVYDGWLALGDYVDKIGPKPPSTHPLVRNAVGLMWMWFGPRDKDTLGTIPSGCGIPPEPISGEIVNDTVLDP